MSRQLIVGVTLLLVLAAAADAGDVETRVVVDGQGRMQLSGLPAILEDGEVQRHLASGLTTSFIFRVRPPRPMEPGAARIDIRLELWDEVYLVSLIDGEGRLTELQHESSEALRSWWSGAEVALSAPGASGVRGPVKVSLDVIPFSQAELLDTQRWLAESMGQAQAGSTRPGRSGGVSRAVGALIATSIQRRAVRAWTWSTVIGRRADS